MLHWLFKIACIQVDCTTSLLISVYISELPCTTGEMVTKDIVALANIMTSTDGISAGLYSILTVYEAVWNKTIIR